MDAIRERYARWAAGDFGEDDQWGDDAIARLAAWVRPLLACD